MREALDVLEAEGVHLDAMRLCAFPFPESVRDFIAAHDKVFVVEQNRDAQMRSMLVNELDVEPGQAGAGAALRRHADHRALHRRQTSASDMRARQAKEAV